MKEFPGLAGLRVAIVEDETLVAFLLEDMLESLGCVAAGSAHSLAKAVELAQKHSVFDVAILDMNLNGQASTPVAEALKAAGVPVIYATGYGPGGQKDAIFLEKPFTREQVGRALTAAMRKRAANAPDA